MGHLGHLREEYQALVRRLGGTQVALPEPRDPRAREGWKEILEILYTPEEADLASRMPLRPADLEALSARFGVPAAELLPRLEALCDKGVVLDLVYPEKGPTRYALAPPVVGFFEFSLMRAHDAIPKKRMAEALEAYTRYDDAFMREAFGGETVIGRALVHETALGEEPRPDVLDWERATSILRDARSWAVSLCFCRHKAEHLGKACDAPREVCLSLNAGADFVARRRFGRAIEREEALDLMTGARERGLVQIADNVLDRPTYICNCCGCCCEQLRSINEFDLRGVNPSGFLARSDRERCSGCSRCARACPIAAIRMEGVRAEQSRRTDLAPVVDEERCIGCGVCADTCRKGAMAMVRRPEAPRVPSTTMERILRMAIERGRLTRLLFDEGPGRGRRFLGELLQALVRLGPVERALAEEQVRSRFIRRALDRTRGLLPS